MHVPAKRPAPQPRHPRLERRHLCHVDRAVSSTRTRRCLSPSRPPGSPSAPVAGLCPGSCRVRAPARAPLAGPREAVCLPCVTLQRPRQDPGAARPWGWEWGPVEVSPSPGHGRNKAPNKGQPRPLPPVPSSLPGEHGAQNIPAPVRLGGRACLHGDSCLVSGGPGLGTPVELAGSRGREAMLTLSYVIACSAGTIRRAARRHRQVWAGGWGQVCWGVDGAVVGTPGPPGRAHGPWEGEASQGMLPAVPRLCPLWVGTRTGVACSGLWGRRRVPGGTKGQRKNLGPLAPGPATCPHRGCALGLSLPTWAVGLWAPGVGAALVSVGGDS